jgi:protein subunit release factor B
MLNFGVTPQKHAELSARMAAVGLRESDLEEKFIRSGGKGGQNVNKVATAVYLKHLPSAIEVKMQRERSQALNRFFARRLLCEKLENLRLGKASPEQLQILKVRKQKRRRNRKTVRKLQSSES